MNRPVLAGVFGAVVGMLFYSQFIAPSRLSAQRGQCDVPKSWGALRGGAPYLTFETADGTVRVVEFSACRLTTVTRSQ